MAEDTGNRSDGSTAPNAEMFTIEPEFRSSVVGVPSRAARTAFVYKISNPARH